MPCHLLRAAQHQHQLIGIGKFPGVNTDIAGVELVSCVFCCYNTSCLFLTLYCNAYVVSGVLNETVRSTHEK